MRRDLALLLGALVSLIAWCGPVAADDSEDESGDETVTLEDARLTWGLNNEANNQSHDPTAWNFFSAGSVDAAVGERLSEGAWSQKEDSVAIEKWNGSKYAPATWGGLSTDASGDKVERSRKNFSNHRFAFSDGSGTVDIEAGTADITWDGSVTVNFYGGQSRFQISDPVLHVEDGEGRVTATLSGSGGSRDGSGDTEVEPEEVAIADFSNVSFEDTGFSKRPEYAEVEVDTASHGSVQGAFPQSFITFQDNLGTAAFWYNSNGSSDSELKQPLRLAVSFDASDPVDEEEPEDTEEPAPDNGAPTAPTPTATEDDDDDGTVSNTAHRPGSRGQTAPTMLASPPASGVPAVLAGNPLRLVSSLTSGDEAPLWIVGIVLFSLAATTFATALALPRWIRRKSRTGSHLLE